MPRSASPAERSEGGASTLYFENIHPYENIRTSEKCLENMRTLNFITYVPMFSLGIWVCIESWYHHLQPWFCDPFSGGNHCVSEPVVHSFSSIKGYPGTNFATSNSIAL